MPSSAVARGDASPAAWAQRCASNHSIASPAVVAKIKADQANVQRYGKMRATTDRLEKCAYLSSASAMPTLRAFRAGSSAPGGASPGAGIFAAANQQQKEHAYVFSPTLRRTATVVSKGASKKPAAGEMVTGISVEQDEEEEERNGAEADAALAAMEDTLSLQMGADYVSFGAAVTPYTISAAATPPSAAFGFMGTLAASPVAQPTPQFSAAGAVMHSELRELLAQFQTEPREAADMAAKWALYEEFQQTVEVVRSSVLEFWGENAGHFPHEVRAHTEREIKAIDSTKNLGVDDPSGSTWIIYYMTVKCHNNSTMITGLLSLIKARIGLLAQEPGDCPCCLRPMEGGNTRTLGCCHQTCADCWVQWRALKGDAAFCPVCRAEEFVKEVVSVVG